MNILYVFITLFLYFSFILDQKSIKKQNILLWLILSVVLLITLTSFTCFIFSLGHIPITYSSLGLVNLLLGSYFYKRNKRQSYYLNNKDLISFIMLGCLIFISKFILNQTFIISMMLLISSSLFYLLLNKNKTSKDLSFILTLLFIITSKLIYLDSTIFLITMLLLLKIYTYRYINKNLILILLFILSFSLITTSYLLMLLSYIYLFLIFFNDKYKLKGKDIFILLSIFITSNLLGLYYLFFF